MNLEVAAAQGQKYSPGTAATVKTESNNSSLREQSTAALASALTMKRVGLLPELFPV